MTVSLPLQSTVIPQDNYVLYTATYVGLSQDIYYVDENSGMVDVCVDVLQSPSFPVDVGLGTAPVTATGKLVIHSVVYPQYSQIPTKAL